MTPTPTPGAVINMPKRIQRRRTKGWRMPEGAVYVGRPTRWGNPFRVGAEITEFPYRDTFGPVVRDAAHAVEIFESYARITTFYDAMVRVALAGRDLACWCPLNQPCHADVLLEIANDPSVIDLPRTSPPFRDEPLLRRSIVTVPLPSPATA